MKTQGPRPLVPPARVFVTLVSLAAAAALVRLGLLEPLIGGIVDAAVRNIITLILAFSGVVSVLGWFLFQSGHSGRLKRGVAIGLLAAVGLACAVLRIERVSGDLVPQFMFRWSPSRDRTLPKASATAAAAAAPWEATPRDFPRFLGPVGSAAVEGPAVEPDWDARPPERLWRRPIGAGWSGFVTCGDHAVTLEQRGEEEVVSCQSVATGEVEWTVAVPGRHQTVLGGIGPRSTPTIADGVVYATGATGWLHAIDGATGRVLWKKNILDDVGIDPEAHAVAVAWGRSGSPLVTESLVIVPAGGPRKDGSAVSLAAYDRTTGERRWFGGEQQISYVSPQLLQVGGREVVLTVNESNVAGHDPADGAELWSFDWPGHSNSDATCSQAHVLDGGRRIFITKGYGVGAAMFEAADGVPPVFAAAWRQPAFLKTKFTNVTVHDGHAYGLSDGILECVSLADGKRCWKGGRYGQGQVLRVGGFLLVQAESGEVVLVDCAAEKHVVRARLAALDGQTWNNPCLSGDRLLVRNAEEAACYRLPLAASEPAP
ncbi:MAG: PQQ-binding-like beta-propeller repeat protein [Planctomycetaceae bacterium]